MIKKILTIVICCFFLGCCKEKDKPLEQHLIPAEMKAYWDFKPGSWWIYQDSATGAIDTVKVLENINGIDTGYEIYSETNVIYEYLVIKTYNTGDGYYNNYTINTLAQFVDEPYGNFVTRTKYNTTNSLGTIRCFLYPLIVGYETSVGYGFIADTCIIRYKVDNFINFTCIYRIDNTFNIIENEHNSRTYFSKNIGIIRYEVPYYNKVQKLIDYYLIP